MFTRGKVNIHRFYSVRVVVSIYPLSRPQTRTSALPMRSSITRMVPDGETEKSAEAFISKNKAPVRTAFLPLLLETGDERVKHLSGRTTKTEH